MRNLKFILPVMLLAIVISFAGCGNTNDKDVSDNNTKTEETSDNKQEAPKDAEGQVVTVQLPTMQCNMCKGNIEGAVSELEGINGVKVSVKEKTATVSFDNSKTDLTKIVSSITTAGYDANDTKADKEAYTKLDDCCKVPSDREKKEN